MHRCIVKVPTFNRVYHFAWVGVRGGARKCIQGFIEVSANIEVVWLLLLKKKTNEEDDEAKDGREQKGRGLGRLQGEKNKKVQAKAKFQGHSRLAGGISSTVRSRSVKVAKAEAKDDLEGPRGESSVSDQLSSAHFDPLPASWHRRGWQPYWPFL